MQGVFPPLPSVYGIFPRSTMIISRPINMAEQKQKKTKYTLDSKIKLKRFMVFSPKVWSISYVVWFLESLDNIIWQDRESKQKHNQLTWYHCTDTHHPHQEKLKIKSRNHFVFKIQVICSPVSSSECCYILNFWTSVQMAAFRLLYQCCRFYGLGVCGSLTESKCSFSHKTRNWPSSKHRLTTAVVYSKDLNRVSLILLFF